jgi:hypothetical protein
LNVIIKLEKKMNKTLKLFSLVAGFATLGSQINAYASDLTSSCNEEIVSYRTALNGTEELFPVTAMTGFSGTEQTHTWSLDDNASLSFPLIRNGKRLFEVSLPNTGALVSSHYPQQTVVVAFTGGNPNVYEYTTDAPYQSIIVQLPAYLSGDNAILEFHTPDSCLVSIAFPGAQDPRKLGISVNSVLLNYVQAKDPLEATDGESKRRNSDQATTPHPFAATNEQIKRLNDYAEKIYRDPVKVYFTVQGDSLRCETVRITCSDARSVLLPSQSRAFCEPVIAIMPEHNLANFEEQIPVVHYDLPSCYYAFQTPDHVADKKGKFVQTYNFGDTINLNGLSHKVSKFSDIWTYNGQAWEATFDYYPWAPGILMYMSTNQDMKNESSLYFQIVGDIAGVTRSKFARNLTYNYLTQESAEIVVEEEFKQDMNFTYNRYFRNNSNKLKNPYVIIHWLLNQMFPEAKTLSIAQEVVNKCLSIYLQTQMQRS